MAGTPTLHKPGVAGRIGGSLRTTTIIQNISSHLGKRSRRVKRSMNSYQRQRRVAMAMTETEPRRKVLRCTEHVRKLREALSECVSKQCLESTSNRLRPPEIN